MTARQVFESILVELNKVNAPSLLIEEYNYFINKAINQYVNKRYNLYDSSQQTTDDLHVLKATAIFSTDSNNSSYLLTKSENVYHNPQNSSGLNNNLQTNIFGATYSGNLPLDYFHMLNCICEFVPTKNFKCYDKNYPVAFAARRLTADMYGGIIQNYYMRPMYKRPYYYIHNVNTITEYNKLPVNTIEPNIDEIGEKTSYVIGEKPNVERDAQIRYGNQMPVRIELRYGNDDTLFELKNVYIDYLKTPKYIRLTQAQIDLTEDTSQVLEFPDYVIQEIINEATMLIAANQGDPRLNTIIPTHQSIANPTPQAQPQQRG